MAWARRGAQLLGFATPFEWLLLLAGLAFTWRYFWFMDDAFIYFRYVDNLLFLGRGLVFNAGEYVEAYSSPLWTLFLVPLRATTLDYYTLLRGVALLACCAYWLTAVHLSRRLSPPGPRASFGVALAMTHYGVLAYFSSGLETPLVQLAACAFALSLAAPERRLWQALAGLAPLARPELALPLAALAGWLLLTRRRVPWWLLITAAVTGIGWLSFRVYYYAELFPNTYYLKDQTELSQGLHYFKYSLGSHHLLLVLALGLAAALLDAWRRRRRAVGAAQPVSLPDSLAGDSSAPGAEGAPPDAQHVSLPDSLAGDSSAPGAEGAAQPVSLPGHTADSTSATPVAASRPRWVRLGLLVCALAALPYPLKVGGDMVYYRFLAFPVCAGLLALSGVLERLLEPLGARLRRWLYPALGLLVAGLSASAYPSQLSAHPATLAARVGHYHGISDGAWHRQLEELAPSPERARFDRERRAQYRAATPGERAGVRVEVGGWCAADYRKWDRVIIHEWGLTEPALARATVRADRPGHKLGLKPLARQLVLLRRRALLDPSAPRGLGFYRYAATLPNSPSWVQANLPALELIEQKTYNRHVFGENLRLALKRPIVHIPPRPTRH